MCYSKFKASSSVSFWSQATALLFFSFLTTINTFSVGKKKVLHEASKSSSLFTLHNAFISNTMTDREALCFLMYYKESRDLVVAIKERYSEIIYSEMKWLLSFSYVLDRIYKIFSYTNILLRKKVDDFWKGCLLFCCLFLEFYQRKGYLVYSLYSNLNDPSDLLWQRNMLKCIKINMANNTTEGQYLWKFNTQYTTCTSTSRGGPLLYWMTQNWYHPHAFDLQKTERVFDTEWLHEALCPIPTHHFQIFCASPMFWSLASELSF